MSEQDSDERTEHDSAPEEQDPGQGSGTDQADESGEADVSASGVVVEGYETNNAPREQTRALLEAESPHDVEDDLIKEIEEERDRRLDPENRPDNVEVDNTKRVFVPAEAKFEDSEIDQDPSLGQQGLAPVGGEAGDGGATGSDESDGSDDVDSSDHIEPDVESGDPKDETTTKTSGTPDPTDSDGSGDQREQTSSAGKHKA